MGEDLSASFRTGIVVVLVSALITAVLNLMAVANNIMSGGLSTLEGSIDMVNVQEFTKYDQGKLSGTSVKTAISLYSNKDIAIVVRTSACIENRAADGAWAYIYGSMLQSTSGTKPTAKQDSESNTYYIVGQNVLTQKSGEAFYTAEYWTENGIIQMCNNTRGINTSGDSQVILNSSRFRSMLIKNAAGAIVGIYFEQYK